MAVEITTLYDADPDYEVKELRLESVYRAAYQDRYKRLGYVVESRRTETQNGKKYTVIVLKRDRNLPGYDSLNKLEHEIMNLVAEEPHDEDVTGRRDKKRRHSLLVMLIIGIIIAALGVVLLIMGMLTSNIVLALGGWGAVIAGGVLMIIWSFMREGWRLRRIDEDDAIANPGFGEDEISRQVEEKLKAADKVRAGISAK